MSSVTVSVILGVSGLVAGGIYWLTRNFVSEKTCQARQDCIEGKIDTLSTLVKIEFKHVRELLDKLIGE